MEDDAPPPPPAPTPLPAPPSASALTADALQANLKYAPEFLAQNKELMPQYAQLMTDIQKQQAPQLSEINLEQQKVFGPQLIDAALANVKRADPTGFQIREKLGAETLADLVAGGSLTPEEERARQQDVRGAQVSRGVGTGLGDAFDEARYLGNERFMRKQARLSNAGSFLAGRPPEASFGAVNQAGKTAPVGTQDASPFASMMPSTNSLIGATASGYGSQVGGIMGMNNLAQRQYEYVDQNTSNPWLTGLAAFGSWSGQVLGGAGGGAAGAAMMCWVAEELYGKESAVTRRIRSFMTSQLARGGRLARFARAYVRHGQRWAWRARHDGAFRVKALRLWNQFNTLALQEA